MLSTLAPERQIMLRQLIRFGIVGFSLAALYSVIYWVLATYVMSPMAAVLTAFLIAVSIGFVLHSRWSFQGHGQAEDRQLKIKFLAVQTSGFLLNEIFTWVLTGPLHGPTWWPLVPSIAQARSTGWLLANSTSSA